MLSIDQIIQFAKSNKLTKNILKEYFQQEILDSFFKQDGSFDYSFIGGTAIRIIYGSQRYSEDLDFDTTNIDSFDSLLPLVIHDMETKGFEIEFRLIHKGAYHCHIKFPSVLHTYGLSGYAEEKILIKFDAAPIPKLYTITEKLSNYGIYRLIQVAPSSVLLAKKLLTICARKRPKGRDLYDVTWLWGMGDPDEIYLKEVSDQSIKEVLTQVKDYVATLNLGELAIETKGYLIKREDVDRILTFPDFIEQKLKSL
jgi:predicted nucleotidyltransferase component of viral defense system